VILNGYILAEISFADARADGLYNLAFCRYNEGRVAPPSVSSVPTEEPKSLTESDELAEEGASVSENEVSGLELADSSALSGTVTGKRGAFGCGHGTNLLVTVYPYCTPLERGELSPLETPDSSKKIIDNSLWCPEWH